MTDHCLENLLAAMTPGRCPEEVLAAMNDADVAACMSKDAQNPAQLKAELLARPQMARAMWRLFFGPDDDGPGFVVPADDADSVEALAEVLTWEPDCYTLAWADDYIYIPMSPYLFHPDETVQIDVTADLSRAEVLQLICRGAEAVKVRMAA